MQPIDVIETEEDEEYQESKHHSQEKMLNQEQDDFKTPVNVKVDDLGLGLGFSEDINFEPKGSFKKYGK